MPNPISERDSSEWIELYNSSPEPVDISGWSLDGNEFIGDSVLGANDFLIITKNKESFISEFGLVGNIVEMPISLRNTADEIVFVSKEGAETRVGYSDPVSGASIELKVGECGEYVQREEGNTVGDDNSSQCIQRDPGLEGLIINELLPNPVGVDSGEEWIEVFNSTESRVNMGGVRIFDAKGEVHRFENDYVIGAGGYSLINLDKAVLNNCLDSSCVEQVSLRYLDEVLDTMSYSDALPGKSISREPNGDYSQDYQLTPGSKNIPNPKIPRTLVISEIFPIPKSGEQEWVEIYNFGDKKINLSEWYLGDNSSMQKIGNMAISPKEYIVLDELGISLNNSGDKISLIHPDGEVVDYIVYDQLDGGTSWARYPVSSGGYGDRWAETTSVTPKLKNVISFKVEQDVQEEKLVATPARLVEASTYTTEELVVESPVVYKAPKLETVGIPELNQANRFVKFPLWILFAVTAVAAGVWLAWDTGLVEKYLAKAKFG